MSMLFSSGIGASIIGAGAQMYSMYAQGQAASQRASAEAQALQANANAAASNAQAALDKMAWEEEMLREKIRSTVGQQKAVYAQAGFKTGTGTPWQVAMETMIKGEKDILALRYGGKTEAYRNLAMAENYRQGARYALAAGKAASRTATIGSVLSGATSFYNIFDVMGKPR